MSNLNFILSSFKDTLLFFSVIFELIKLLNLLVSNPVVDNTKIDNENKRNKIMINK